MVLRESCEVFLLGLQEAHNIVWYADVPIANAMAVCESKPHCVIRGRVEANATTVCVLVCNAAVCLM